MKIHVQYGFLQIVDIIYTCEKYFDITHHTFNNLLMNKVRIRYVLCKTINSICTIRLIVENGMHEVAHHL
jgi:hypothetical protein